MQHNVCEQLFSAAADWAANQWLQREIASYFRLASYFNKIETVFM